MDDIRIYRKDNAQSWFITDEHGEHPVTFVMGDVGWKVNGPVPQFGEPEESDDSIEVEFTMHNKKHRLDFQRSGKFFIEGEPWCGQPKEFFLVRGNPFTQFFKKTGKHVVYGNEITIPVYHSFEKQIYG